ncbi:MAG: hypothetical protein QNJ87_03270 [Gammaproteobacteria bacterium]|nr:hypothetical protein [Gammaproteobacteria bacterium]
MKLTTYSVSLVAAVLVGFTGLVQADSKCSNVNIQITNEYRDPVKKAKVDIKVVDFEYWDKEDDKWRDEATRNKRIHPGQTETWNKNLGKVGGQTGTKLKVHYRYRQAGSRWSAKHTKVSSPFKCVDGTAVAVVVK